MRKITICVYWDGNVPFIKYSNSENTFSVGKPIDITEPFVGFGIQVSFMIEQNTILFENVSDNSCNLQFELQPVKWVGSNNHFYKEFTLENNSRKRIGGGYCDGVREFFENLVMFT